MKLSRFRSAMLNTFVTVLFVVILPLAGRSGQHSEKCFLWKITSKNTTVYVLGSMHLGHPQLYPLSKEIENAFAQSKALAVELNTEKVDPEKSKELTLKKVTYQDGESLQKNLSKKTLDLLRQFCEKKKLNIKNFERVRPCGVWLALSSQLGPIPKGWSAAEGIDFYFLDKAITGEMPILELETIESSLWSAELSAQLQDTLLATALLDEAAGITFPWEEMAKVWKVGDIDSVERIVFGDTLKRHPQYRGIFEKMFDDRNVRMVEKIEGYLASGKTTFVVVGAGHLVGSKAIVRLLQDKKYQVTQVTSGSVPK